MKDGSVGHALAVVAVSLLTAGGVSAAVTGAKPNLNVQGAKLASAAQLPRWNIDEICASDSAGGQCRILEDQAYRTLSGGWYAVPDSFRDTCLATIKSPYDKSYRLLSQCLEGQVLVGLDKDAVKTAVVKDGKVRVAQAGGSNAAPVAAPSNGYPALPTSNVADLFKAREAWGAGAAKPVAAPLAAGAVSPLPADNAAVPKGFDGQPTVHALEATPVAQLTPVPQNQIADAMKKLLAERESWLKAPSSAAAAAPAAPAQAGGNGGSGYAVLPTTNVADLFKAREVWGTGTAKEVAAPLAAGAFSPLPADSVAVPKGFDGQPTVHPLEATPVAQLTAVPLDKIADAMKMLLAEREGWGKAPTGAATTAAPASAPAAAASTGGYAVLPTTNVADLFKARETWGTGTAKAVASPLAAGAFSPLPEDSVTVPKGFDGQPTVHPLEATPVAQL
ncbi:MAG: hypothetical protein KDJ18_09900, partial [Hyphomicrobiaceae bacterium]|nr:hypothetical protein [Hyphomicrobiaceae bacterium]